MQQHLAHGQHRPAQQHLKSEKHQQQRESEGGQTETVVHDHVGYKSTELAHPITHPLIGIGPFEVGQLALVSVAIDQVADERQREKHTEEQQEKPQHGAEPRVRHALRFTCIGLTACTGRSLCRLGFFLLLGHLSKVSKCRAKEQSPQNKLPM
jgi:hypothetical protein